jgi:hypothetical protein
VSYNIIYLIVISVVIALVGMVIFFAVDPESRIIFGPV